jgi:UDPglucose 6-dehydrogenase
MKIYVVGTDYLGLVTEVALSHIIGNYVTCIVIVQTKVEKMLKGISPIYEPGLEELMKIFKPGVYFLLQTIKSVLQMLM